MDYVQENIMLGAARATTVISTDILTLYKVNWLKIN